ncbi:MAG: D-Ala-D-Ala carboxypeptidase family metallohydrolase [Candidatus Izemoplasmatales bacterium]|nr:D-Ala-D-Ala carboxypeptidase family metallohydrolase [Candidatus Izemoplasmatales bacterium]
MKKLIIAVWREKKKMMTLKDKMGCPCKQCRGKDYDIDALLLELLSKLEDELAKTNKTMNINSGLRCLQYNNEVGGVPNSPHVSGMAADIVVPGMDLLDLARLCLKIGFKRIGIYPNHIHVDVATPKPSKFWYVKRYGDAIIYSKNINDLEEFINQVIRR